MTSNFFSRGAFKQGDDLMANTAIGAMISFDIFCIAHVLVPSRKVFFGNYVLYDVIII